MKEKIIKIIGDTHNVEALSIILEKYDNLISLGDIAAVETKEYLKNSKEYSIAWRAFLEKRENGLNPQLKKWFEDININGWERQLSVIKNSGKKLIVNQGNSDLRMLTFFDECEKKLKETENEKFRMIKIPEIVIKNKIVLFFLPYSDNEYLIDDLVEELTKHSSKKLFVLAHCPAYEKHRKKYYEHHYEAIEKISNNWEGDLYYIHGHVHPDNSYIYKDKKLKNVIFIAPKAEDSVRGIGYNHHILELDTSTGDYIFIDNNSGDRINLLELPLEYNNMGHWNSFYIRKG